MPAINTHTINSYFGDMDLYLIDAILKGHVPRNGKVLDVGCGDGRNGLFFIKEHFEYHGTDQDISKIQFAEYFVKNFPNDKARFECASIEDLTTDDSYNLIIASRVLHFAQDEKHFIANWEKLTKKLKIGGVIYFAMDSGIASDHVKKEPNGHFKFKDGRTSFALTQEIYNRMADALVEVEPLRTIIHGNKRVQSFGLLQKP